jgi:hypothetical protein
LDQARISLIISRHFILTESDSGVKSHDGEKPRASRALGGCTAGLLGLILTPVLVNLLGAVVFYNHPSYGSAQGLGSLLFYLGVLSAPLGALYWGVVVDRMREAKNARRAVVTGAGIYLLSVLATVLGIGWSYGTPR